MGSSQRKRLRQGKMIKDESNQEKQRDKADHRNND